MNQTSRVDALHYRYAVQVLEKARRCLEPHNGKPSRCHASARHLGLLCFALLYDTDTGIGYGIYALADESARPRAKRSASEQSETKRRSSSRITKSIFQMG